MRRRIKLICVAFSLCLSLGVTTFGVLAVTSAAVSVENNIQFTQGEQMYLRVIGTIKDASGRQYAQYTGSNFEGQASGASQALPAWSASDPVELAEGNEAVYYSFSVDNYSAFPVVVAFVPEDETLTPFQVLVTDGSGEIAGGTLEIASQDSQRLVVSLTVRDLSASFTKAVRFRLDFSKKAA